MHPIATFAIKIMGKAKPGKGGNHGLRHWHLPLAGGGWVGVDFYQLTLFTLYSVFRHNLFIHLSTFFKVQPSIYMIQLRKLPLSVIYLHNFYA